MSRIARLYIVTLIALLLMTAFAMGAIWERDQLGLDIARQPKTLSSN